jgi:UDP-4-amino-4,6-dideoxy-N-acetyl-beta-L-altrosamine transaminase
MIPYGRQEISEADIQAVVDVLRSEFLTQGPAVPQFERLVTEYCGARFGVAVNSATSALHIACLALDVRPGDLVWTSPITFVASANCARYCGADVDFVDIDAGTYNMSVACLSEKLADAERHGRLPKVVIPVHLCGQSCDMAAIRTLGRQYGFSIIEDASHAIGGRYRGDPIGGCRYSDITIFSFHPVKVITTGEGGMALTNDAVLGRRLALLRSHGITRDRAEMTHDSEGPWYYQQIDLGFNYRMTDLQAALGASQMGRVNDFVERRHLIARRYDEMLAGLPLRVPTPNPDAHSALHLYVIRLAIETIEWTHRDVFEALRARGIGVNLHYIPVYRQPYYERLGFAEGYCPEAERYYAEAMSLPIYPALSEADQHHVADSLRSVLLHRQGPQAVPRPPREP